MLVEFGSAVDVVRSSLEVQRRMAEQRAPPRRRIKGWNFASASILATLSVGGDGSARRRRQYRRPAAGHRRTRRHLRLGCGLQRQVEGKVDCPRVTWASRPLKNIAEPVWVFAVDAGVVAATANQRHLRPAPGIGARSRRLRCCRSPTCSGDAAQEYFADGITEDISPSCRASAAVRHRAQLDLRLQGEPGRRAGRWAASSACSYVVEGSVRKAATGSVSPCS